MTNFETQAQTPTPQARKPFKQAIVRKNPDGSSSLVFVSSKSDVENIDRYLDAAMGQVKCDREQAARKWAESTKCFHCEDKGFVTVRHTTARGGYPFTYQCECQLGEPGGFAEGVETVRTLERQGIYKHYCQMGGPTGSTCFLPARQEKCYRFNCTKFKKEENAHDDNR